MRIRSWSRIRSCVIALGVACVLAPSSAIALTVYTDRAAFELAAGPLFGEGFEAPFSRAPSIDFGPFTANVGFGNVISNDGASNPQFVSEGERSIYGFDGTQPASIGNTMRFNFDTSIHAFGVDINAFAAPLINVQGTGSDPLLVTTLWDVASDGPAPPTIFFGVVDPVPFSEVAIFWSNNQFVASFDDLVWSNVVPEPGTGTMMLLGLGLMAGSRRSGRRRPIH